MNVSQPSDVAFLLIFVTHYCCYFSYSLSYLHVIKRYSCPEHLRSTGHHLLYGITQCCMPLMKSTSQFCWHPSHQGTEFNR